MKLNMFGKKVRKYPENHIPRSSETWKYDKSSRRVGKGVQIHKYFLSLCRISNTLST